MIPPVDEPLLIHCRTNYYDGKLPFFYDPKDFPELSIITENWKIILQELEDYEAKHGVMQGISTYSPPDVEGENPWSNLYLENFMWRYHHHRKHFPKTCALLEKIPNLTFASFASLAPGGRLAPHYGDTNAVIRCHLGLKIPAPLPICGIEAGSVQRGWEEGKLTMFSEAHRHWVWNDSDQKRYIFCIDIVHPHWARQRQNICARVLGAQTFVFLERRLPFLKSIPDKWLPPILWVLSAIWRIYLPVQRMFGVFYK
jgi:aspartyl/asparaginyl beta-hydroxylase (cupin superfamily)